MSVLFALMLFWFQDTGIDVAVVVLVVVVVCRRWIETLPQDVGCGG